MRPLQFVDPRDVKPLRLDRAALEVLLEKGLELAPRSVLHALLESEDEPNERARAEAGAELGLRGALPGGTVRPSPEAELLVRSLSVLASPDAELRVESHRPGEEEDDSADRSYFLSGDGVAPVTWLDDGLLVHAALRTDAFAAQLSKLFQPSPAPKDFAPLALARSQVEAARLLWGEEAQASQSVSRKQAISNAQKFDTEGGDGAGLVDLLIETDVLVETNGMLSLAPGVRDALTAIWSGESHELVVRDLEDDASPDDPEGVGVASFYVAGAAGHRVIVDMSEAIDDSPADSAASDAVDPEPDEALDTEVLQFTWLTREEMNQSLEALLGLWDEPAGGPTP